MNKLLISDFKNTIIDKEDSIDSEIIIKIDNFRRNKNKFIISTDLDYKDILYYDKSFHFIDYIISYSGSIIYDVNKNKIIYKKHILIDKVRNIIKSIDNIINIYKENNKVYRIDIYNTKDNLKIIKELNLNYYIDDDIIIIIGSNINDSINYIVKDKYNKDDILCIGYDNKFINCKYNLIGLSNSKLKIKKIKYNNNELGLLKIIDKL